MESVIDKQTSATKELVRGGEHPDFKSLPVELKMGILCCLPDDTSMIVLAHTCRDLCSIVKEHQQCISEQILRNQLDANLLPDALAALESSRTPKGDWTLDSADRFIERYTNSRNSFRMQSWELASVQPLLKFHKYVKHFAESFALEYLNRVDNFRPNARASQLPLSQSELTRIQRSLYRFEIYCNLSAVADTRLNLVGTSFSTVYLLHKLAAWESEQLICVYDHLRSICTTGK